jgi:predicted permease
MTDIISLLYQFVITFVLIVLIIRVLKRRGVFNDTHQPIFDRLVTEFALPAVIFSSLATMTFRPDWLATAGILFLAIVVSGIVAYAVCRALALPSKTTGSVVIVAAFGSTATFAAPLISAAYGEHSIAVAQAMVDGTLGVAIPFFTIGVMVAVYFGMDEEKTHRSIFTALKDFLTTPIFIAFILGLIVSAIITGFQIPGTGVFSDVFTGFFAVIDHSLDLLVWIAIGLMLHPLKAKNFLPLLALVVFVKMILQPLLVLGGAYAFGFPLLEQQVVFLEAAMPSGAIAAVLASRYGCNGPLAAALVIATYLVSLVTIPLALLTFG